MENFTLFGANAVVVFVMASAFFVAGRARKSEQFWTSWFLANVVIGFAILAFMFERNLPDLFLVTVPNVLLVLGLSWRWRAAREFAGRAVSPLALWGPSILFIVVCAWPWVFGSYGAVYTIVNALLTCLAVASGFEFWRDRGDGLPSRYGMVAAYGIIAASFAARVGQGLWQGSEMSRHLPDDLMLMIHLAVALLHIAATGAFALSLAYERDAVRLRRLAMHDSLTGLLNRSAFEARIRDYLATGERHDFAIVLFDLDHFKQINDTYGHAVGDDTLRACAKVFSESLRNPSIVARWGGEEFAAILTNISAADAFAVAERVRRKIRATVIMSGQHEVWVTVSAGVCHSSSGLENFDELLKRADAGLYTAKHNGRDCVQRLVA
ncbi:GGDEF domain-containing protein [Pseudaminobacter arsenicus]|uniref:diguanylate cyclase n=1 Tax=Borborobacter arsenicus TaxID=1851146 RepID=A0A432V4K4_9HYPH|nr:GGDEF domain-containing protein [Pseudaminobacter arsenicus]RUM97085.1 GGDEF domain-containing protein [Pseudaminobacter arsenicus]